MPRILFDHGTPIGLRSRLFGHQVVLAREMGWEQIGNGDLLDAAERAGFDILVTADKNIRYQQNLRGRSLAIVVLGTNHWQTIRASAELVEQAIALAESGKVVEVEFGRPPRR